MPYEWHHEDPGTSRLALWPHRPLQARGFASFVAITAMLMALPLLATLGTSILWVLLAFIAATLAAVWFALRRNIRDRQLLEELTLTHDLAHLSHHCANGKTLDWQANPYWVTVTLHPTGGPVPHYLTLKGETPREVELGRFLTEAERQRLAPELRQALHRLR
jgi:uncharacterized membrane protein